MSDKSEAARNALRQKLAALRKELALIVRNMDEYEVKLKKY